MLMNSGLRIRVLVCVLAFAVLGGCASIPEPQGLQSGTWVMQIADSSIVDVEISKLQASDYYFDAGKHPISGIYSMEGDQILMHLPDNPRMKEFLWRQRADRSLILIAEPSTELSGIRLISSTLVGPL